MNSESIRISPIPKRHWSFTTWLILAVVGNIYLATKSGAGFVFAIANLVLVAALYKWRRWGFNGYVVMATVAFILSLTDGRGFGISVSSFVSVAILCGVLNLGGERKAWPHLK
jgi:hypothetical protein